MYAIMTHLAEYSDDPYVRDYNGNILMFPTEEEAAWHVAGADHVGDPFDCTPIRLGVTEIVKWDEDWPA